MTERFGYSEIAAHFRQKINDGELRPGDEMPSMRKVQEEFSVTSTTANRAYRVLKNEGLTTSKPGIGTVVADGSRRAVITGVQRIERLNRTGREFAANETSTDHSAAVLSCRDPEFAAMLDIDPGDEVVVRRRTFRRDGVPTSFGISIIHLRAKLVVPEITQQGQLKPFWQKTYKERTGKEIYRSPEQRMARLAMPDELATLEVPLPSYVAVPVLALRTVFHDDDGPIEVWEDVYTPGLWQHDPR